MNPYKFCNTIMEGKNVSHLVANKFQTLDHFMEQPVDKDIFSCDKSYKLLHKCQKFAKSIRLAIDVCLVSMNMANNIL